MTSKKPEPALFLDMDFQEALARYAKTKPEEVDAPPGKTKKTARPPIKSKPDGGPSR